MKEELIEIFNAKILNQENDNIEKLKEIENLKN
jgi:hypothetical protein